MVALHPPWGPSGEPGRVQGGRWLGGLPFSTQRTRGPEGQERSQASSLHLVLVGFSEGPGGGGGAPSQAPPPSGGPAHLSALALMSSALLCRGLELPVPGPGPA